MIKHGQLYLLAHRWPKRDAVNNNNNNNNNSNTNSKDKHCLGGGSLNFSPQLMRQLTSRSTIQLSKGSRECTHISCELLPIAYCVIPTEGRKAHQNLPSESQRSSLPPLFRSMAHSLVMHDQHNNCPFNQRLKSLSLPFFSFPPTGCVFDS